MLYYGRGSENVLGPTKKWSLLEVEEDEQEIGSHVAGENVAMKRRLGESGQAEVKYSQKQSMTPQNTQRRNQE